MIGRFDADALSPGALFAPLERAWARARRQSPAMPRLLIVDDEPAVRAFVLRALSLVECEIVAAVNGPDAREVFSRTAPIDLLLSDLMMPGMTGLELGRRLQAETPDLKVLYLTGHSDALFEERPILGANEAFVDKPITPRGLQEAVSLALFGHLAGLSRRDGAPAPKPPALGQHTA